LHSKRLRRSIKEIQMKRIGAIAGILLIATVSILALNAHGDSAVAGPGGGARTMRLTLLKQFFHSVDQAPRGNSVGDAQIFGGELIGDGHRRGRLQAYCVVISATNQECSFTYALHGGQLASLVGYGRGFSGSHSSHDPIAGGSGVYAGARGEISDREVSAQKDRLVFRLVR
jgi:hypothetical protein